MSVTQHPCALLREVCGRRKAGYARAAMCKHEAPSLTPKTAGGIRSACRAVLCGLLCLWAVDGFADGAPDDLCDIQVDTRMSLYMVMADGQPYRDKRYLTWDDALKLRDFLVADGVCERAAPAKDCEVKLLTAGDYAVIRDGVSFDPYVKLRTLDAAHEYAATLAKVKLCKPIRR